MPLPGKESGKLWVGIVEMKGKERERERGRLGERIKLNEREEMDGEPER